MKKSKIFPILWLIFCVGGLFLFIRYDFPYWKYREFIYLIVMLKMAAELILVMFVIATILLLTWLGFHFLFNE